MIDQVRHIKIQPKTINRPQQEALGNNYRVCGAYILERALW